MLTFFVKDSSPARPTPWLQFFLNHIIWYLAAVSLVAWIFKSYFFSDSVLGGVAPFHFDLAEKTWFFQNIRDGHLYWLYPHNELGHFVATNPASGLLFLPNFIFAILPPPVAQKLLFLFHYLILFSGLASLLGCFGSKQSSYILALLGLSMGISISLPFHVALPYVSFFPWSIVMTRNLWINGRGVLKAGTSVAFVFLLGDPVMAAAGGLIGSFLGWSSAPKPSRLRSLLWAGLAVIALCFPHLLAMTMDAEHNSRALGIPTFEALTYSTAPIRFLDWLFPYLDLYDPKAHLGIGFQTQWWFPAIGGGVTVSSLILRGTLKLSPRQRWCVLGTAVFFIHLSLGQFSPLSVLIFDHLPPFSWTRYPERYLTYAWPFLMIAALKGFDSLPGKARLVFALLALLENTYDPKVPRLLGEAERLSSLPSEHWRGNVSHPSRFLLCERGVEGKGPLRYYDVRGHGLSMVNGTSNTRSVGLKYQACPGALSRWSQKWLGWTHVIIPDGRRRTLPSTSFGLSLSQLFDEGQIWESHVGSPLQAYWVDRPVRGELVESIDAHDKNRENLQRASEGELFVEARSGVHRGSCETDHLVLKPNRGTQSFSVEIPEKCHGLLAVPWAMHWGWKTEPRVPILKGNSAIVLLDIPPELGHVELSFSPPYLDLAAIFSIFSQALFGLIILLSERREVLRSSNVFFESSSPRS